MRIRFISTLGLAAVVGGLAVLSCTAARGMRHAQDQIAQMLPVSIFFQANLPDEQTRAAAEALKPQDNAIEQITYLSREQAYAEASKDPLLARSLMLLHDNPLSATVEIRYAPRVWKERSDPAEALRKIPGVQEIRWSAPKRDAYLAFEPWSMFLTKSLWLISLLLLLWAIAGIRAITVDFSGWKTAMTLFGAGLLGATLVTLLGVASLPYFGLTPLAQGWRAVPLLPVLLGGLVGMGSYREVRT